MYVSHVFKCYRTSVWYDAICHGSHYHHRRARRSTPTSWMRIPNGRGRTTSTCTTTTTATSTAVTTYKPQPPAPIVQPQEQSKTSTTEQAQAARQPFLGPRSGGLRRPRPFGIYVPSRRVPPKKKCPVPSRRRKKIPRLVPS